jgi:hypothetical protein
MGAGAAWAGPETALLRKAVARLDAAAKQLKAAAPACRALTPTFEVVRDHVAAIAASRARDELPAARNELAELAGIAGARDCPDALVLQLLVVSDALELARLSFAVKPVAGEAFFAPVAVNPKGVYEGEPAVVVSTGEFRLEPCPPNVFYFAAHFRSFKGDWTEWVTTPAWSCPAKPLRWKNAFSHAFRASRLAEEDVGGGRFLARLSAFDGQGHELAFRDFAFVFGAAATPPSLRPGPPRDCGVSKDDPGCNTPRNGQLPMDAMTFNGFYTALHGGVVDHGRLKILESLPSLPPLTAQRFGKVLTEFTNDVTLLRAAKLAAPYVVDLPRAAPFESRFGPGYFQDEYRALVLRGG